MINRENLQELLGALSFEKKGSIYKKQIGSTTLEVNFAKNQIVYPEADGLVINERQTCNFDSNENFVVFECVHRLLWKGYRPEHIELEPKWKLGHGASGGRAPVLVKDNHGQPLLNNKYKTIKNEIKHT